MVSAAQYSPPNPPRGDRELAIDYTNDAYKLGINYVVYAMVH
jgi:hypothetical protein